MRNRVFRIFAAIFGLLGLPAVLLDLRRIWPPTQPKIEFVLAEASVLYAFLSYGLGFGAMAAPTGYPPGHPGERSAQEATDFSDGSAPDAY